MNPKLILLVAILAISSALETHAAVTFSGGGPGNLVVTVTSELRIPVVGTIQSPGTVFTVVLKDVYSAAQPANSGIPSTAYASGIAAKMERSPSLATLNASSYGTWGSSSRDFVMIFTFNAFFGSQLSNPSLQNIDRVFVISPGTITLPSTYGIQAPDQAVSSIQLYSFGNLIPEPGTALLGALGSLFLMRRRRS